MKYIQMKGTLFFVLLLILVLGCRPKLERHQTISNPSEGLIALMEGNQRFLEDHPRHPDQTLERIRDLKKGQHPYAVIVACSDSRVPPELIFDQGLGDLFVIRNAGNIIGDYELGSVEYAVEHLHTPLVIVLGHTQCGAIGAFIEHKNDSVPNHIQKIIDYIKSEPEELALNENSVDYYEKAVKANLLHGVHAIKKSGPILTEFVARSKVRIVGGLFDLETGKVTIVEE